MGFEVETEVAVAAVVLVGAEVEAGVEVVLLVRTEVEIEVALLARVEWLDSVDLR